MKWVFSHCFAVAYYHAVSAMIYLYLCCYIQYTCIYDMLKILIIIWKSIYNSKSRRMAKPTSDRCVYYRHLSAWSSTHSDQDLCNALISGLQIREHNRKLFSYFSTKTYVVGTQKNRLDETVLLSTQNTRLY